MWHGEEEDKEAEFLFSPQCCHPHIHLSHDRTTITKNNEMKGHDVVTTGVPLPNTGVHRWYIRVLDFSTPYIFVGVINEDGAGGKQFFFSFSFFPLIIFILKSE